MILPEDTKAPIPSDDEFEYQDEYEYEEEYSPYDYDFDSSSPREPRPFVPYTDDPEPYPFDNTDADGDSDAIAHNAGRGDELQYPASPRSTLTHPLLADVSDIELGLGLGPAPPYTPRDENPRSRAAVRAARARTEEAKGKMSRKARLWRMAWKGVVVYLALMGVMTITWRMFGPGRRGGGWDGPHPPPSHSDDGSSGSGRPEQDGGKGGGGGGSPGGWEDHEHDHRPDGVPLECISWDASSYSPFPISISQPHLPAPLDPEIGSRRSTNRTILLPLDGRELFAHLMGSSAIGNFFLSTYDPSDSAVWKGDSEGAITPSEEEEVEIEQGKYLRVIVEAIYDVLPGLEGPADEETSPGWEALLESKVCLMSRNRTLVDPASSSDSEPEPEPASLSRRRNRKDGTTPPFLLPGMGLGAYTRRPASSPHEWHNPLSFRIHIALPTNIPPSLAGSILSALLPLEPHGFGGPPHPNSVRSLDLRGGAMGVYADLDRAALGKLGINSALGEIVLEKTRAEVISIEGNGEVRGDVAISNALEVKTPIGEINLNITLARPPPGMAFPDPPPPPPWETNDTHPDTDVGTEQASNQNHQDHHRRGRRGSGPPDTPGKPVDICSLPPVIVDIFAASESSTLRFVDWEETCRGLRLDVVSLIGEVNILGHPAFEGPVAIHSTLGTIDVLSPEVEDPEGKGRWRNVTMEKNDRLGNKFWFGEVKWEEEQPGAGSEAASDSVEANTKTTAETEIDANNDGASSGVAKPRRRSVQEQAQWNQLESEQSVIPPPPKGHGRQRSTKGMDIRTSVGSIRLEL